MLHPDALSTKPPKRTSHRIDLLIVALGTAAATACAISFAATPNWLDAVLFAMDVFFVATSVRDLDRAVRK